MYVVVISAMLLTINVVLGVCWCRWVPLVFLTARSIRIGLLSSKIHNVDGTPKDSNAYFGSRINKS